MVRFILHVSIVVSYIFEAHVRITHLTRPFNSNAVPLVHGVGPEPLAQIHLACWVCKQTSYICTAQSCAGQDENHHHVVSDCWYLWFDSFYM